MLLSSQYRKIMGVLNVTPDSFYEGSRVTSVNAALKQAEKMIADGVDILDVGGESTRPYAATVSPENEIERVIPIIKALSEHFKIPISIDTYHPETLLAAIDAGASFINDITALQNPQMLAIAAKSQLPVCLMHMQGQPKSMQDAPHYDDVIAEISQFFENRINACLRDGIKKENIILDPGFGFGKTLDHNLTLLARFKAFSKFDCPMLIGLSRKSMFQKICDRQVADRMPASLTAAILAVLQLDRVIIRTHDVPETKDAIRVIQAVQAHEKQPKMMETA